tara:strand:+ start:141 stop:398 length:258 start_codon:yes stop_codon:yes gene_type:complete
MELSASTGAPALQSWPVTRLISEEQLQEGGPSFWELMDAAESEGLIAVGYVRDGENAVHINPIDKAKELALGAADSVVVLSCSQR